MLYCYEVYMTCRCMITLKMCHNITTVFLLIYHCSGLDLSYVLRFV